MSLRPSQHPGTTNAFQVNTGTPLALRYNDVSVLENHHACVAFALLDRSGLLRGLPAHDFKALRRLMVTAILATDMSSHKALLARVEARAAAAAEVERVAAAAAAAAVSTAAAGGAAEGEPAAAAAAAPPKAAASPVLAVFSRDDPEDRQLLVSYLLHTADLCNPLLPPALSRRIAATLSQEFEAQAAAESAAGVPVSVMLAADDAAKAKMEIGFLDYGACAAALRAWRLTVATACFFSCGLAS
jgi:hypothetical protein